jgi:hypothetical protein
MAITAYINKANLTGDYFCKGSIDNVIIARSDQTSQPGFRYFCEVYISDILTGNGTSVSVALQPNPQGVGILNLRPFYNEALRPKTLVRPGTSNPYIHVPAGNGTPPFNQSVWVSTDMTMYAKVYVWEAYEVGGIFEKNAGDQAAVYYTITFGRNSNQIATPKNCTTITGRSAGYTDRTRYTFEKRLWRHKIPGHENAIHVPGLSTDCGVLCLNADDGQFITGHNNDTNDILYTFYDDDNTVLGTFDMSYKGNSSCLAFIPLLPRSVEIQSNFLMPYGTTKYLIQGTQFGDPIMKEYVVVIENKDCLYWPVQLCWIGKQGGWEYFTFTKKSERSINVDRKTWKSPYGNYGTLGQEGYEAELVDGGALEFASNMDPRGIIVRDVNVEETIEITSDWITEEEFRYLENLLTSEYVAMAHYDARGYFIPMIINTNKYVVRKDRGTKKYNLILELQFSQEYDVYKPQDL